MQRRALGFILCHRYYYDLESFRIKLIIFFKLKSYESALPVASDPRVIHVQRNNRYHVCLEVPGICYRSVARPWSVNSRKHVQTYGIPYR